MMRDDLQISRCRIVGECVAMIRGPRQIVRREELAIRADRPERDALWVRARSQIAHTRADFDRHFDFRPESRGFLDCGQWNRQRIVNSDSGSVS
jgi:hypothetical protein